MCVYTSIHLYLYTMSRPKTFAKMSRLGWAFLCWADLLHISTIHWYAVLSFAPWNLTWTRKNKQPLRSHSHFSASSWSYLRLKSPCPRRTVKTPQPHNLSVFSTNPVPEKRIKATFELVLTRAFWNLQPRKVTILSSLRKPELTAQPWDLEEACWNREFLFLSQGTTCHDSSLLVFTNTLLKEVGLALQGDHLHPKSLGSENDPTQTACCGCNIIPTGNCPKTFRLVDPTV